MNNDTDQRTKVLRIGAITLLVLLAFAIFSVFNGPERASQLENEPLEEGQTEIKNSDELRTHINTPQVGFLASDLNLFGENTIEAYRSTEEGSIFTIEGKVKKLDDGTIEFKGKYEKDKSKIRVKLTPKKNDRLVVSITNEASDANIDSQLPSNSKQNQFIASLPITEQEYNITYVPPRTVSISSYIRDPAVLDRAQARIDELLGREEAKKLDISISYPTPGFNE